MKISLQVCALASGSSGNAIYIGSSSQEVLIDVGLSGKELKRRLKKIDRRVEDIDALFLTHEHSDHIKGAGVVARECQIPIYASQGTWVEAKEKLGKLNPEQKKIISTKELTVGNLGIKPFSIPHDACEPVGYSVVCEGVEVAIATDMGEIDSGVKNKITDSDLVVLESNHDLEMLKIGPYPWSVKKRIMSSEGHLSNDEAADLAVELGQKGVRRILLAHLSQDNNIPELAFLTIKNMLVEAGLEVGKDVQLDFAYQEEVSKVYQLG